MSESITIYYGMVLVQCCILGVFDLAQGLFNKPKRLCYYPFLARFPIFFGISYSPWRLRLVGTIDLIFTLFHLISWSAQGIPATIDFLGLMDFSAIRLWNPRIIVSGVLLFIFILGLILFPFKGTFEIASTRFVQAYFIMLMVLPFFMHQTFAGFFLEEGDDSLVYEHPKLVNYLETPLKILSPGNGKNLIAFISESLEMCFLGSHSSDCPESMSFLKNLSQGGFFIDNIPMQPYTTYSVAGAMASTCGIPIIHRRIGDKTDRKYSNIFSTHTKCIGDYLNQSGYYLRADLHGWAQLHGLLLHFEHHGFDAYDYGDDINDREKYEIITNTTIPFLKKLTKPWVLYVNNIDTHMDSYITSKKCTNRVPQCHKLYQTFDCLDENIEWLLKQFEKSGLLNNTELMIYGDHLHMYTPIKCPQPRRMGLWVPKQPARQVNRILTQYDIAPTLLDLLGVKYEPKFPFGASAFSDENTEVPTHDLYKSLKHYFEKERYSSWIKSSQVIINKNKDN